MGKSKRIYNKFEWWSVSDCQCRYCLYVKKNQPCPLETCCCIEEREEALRREQIKERLSCPG